MKRALITGITGQDGAYLADFLLKKKYKVFGTYRRISTPNFWRLQYLGIFDKINLIPADLIDAASIGEAIEISQPDEIYHLAAHSFVGTSFEQPVGTGEVTGLGVARILEEIRQINRKIKFYQASTSELYGDGHTKILDERSAFRPSSPYATAKLYAYWLTKIYRQGYGMFATNGILFNHESPLRGMEFVTRKVTNAVAKIALGMQKELKMGNLNSRRDWGYAPEYVQSMWLMLQHDQPDDFVIATSEEHTVEEFVAEAFAAANLKYTKFIKVDKKLMRPLDVGKLCGDFTKAKEKLGWKPKVKFKELVKIMVGADMDRWQRYLKGKRFAWDAVNYPNEDRIISRTIKLD